MCVVYRRALSAISQVSKYPQLLLFSSLQIKIARLATIWKVPLNEEPSLHAPYVAITFIAKFPKPLSVQSHLGRKPYDLLTDWRVAPPVYVWVNRICLGFCSGLMPYFSSVNVQCCRRGAET